MTIHLVFPPSGVSATADGYTQVAIDKPGSIMPLTYTVFRPLSDNLADNFIGGKGSTHVTVKLEPGEEVVCRHHEGDTQICGGTATTFSGVFMHEYHDNVKI